MKLEISLLCPEWQSYGENKAVHIGALKLVQLLCDMSDFIQIPVPSEEDL